MIINLTYWAWLGTLNLILLTRQDFKNNMLVDDRKNYFMMGISISLLSHLSLKLWYIISLILIVVLLQYGLKKYKLVGEADINSLTWIFIGLGIINPFKLAWFVIFFTIVTAIYMLIKIKFLKNTGKTQFYPVLLLSFIINCVLFGLY